MENGYLQKIGTRPSPFSRSSPSEAQEGLLDLSVSSAFLVLALLESLPWCVSRARLLERDLNLVYLAFFISLESLPLRASSERLLERNLVLVLLCLTLLPLALAPTRRDEEKSGDESLYPRETLCALTLLGVKWLIVSTESQQHFGLCQRLTTHKQQPE